MGGKLETETFLNVCPSKWEKAYLYGLQSKYESGGIKKKKMYYDSKKINGTSGHNQVTCLFGKVLEEPLGSRPLSQVDIHGINIGFGSTPGKLQILIIFIIVQQYNTQCKYTAFTDVDVCWIHVIVIFCRRFFTRLRRPRRRRGNGNMAQVWKRLVMQTSNSAGA